MHIMHIYIYRERDVHLPLMHDKKHRVFSTSIPHKLRLHDDVQISVHRFPPKKTGLHPGLELSQGHPKPLELCKNDHKAS